MIVDDTGGLYPSVRATAAFPLRAHLTALDWDAGFGLLQNGSYLHSGSQNCPVRSALNRRFLLAAPSFYF